MDKTTSDYHQGAMGGHTGTMAGELGRITQENLTKASQKRSASPSSSSGGGGGEAFGVLALGLLGVALVGAVGMAAEWFLNNWIAAAPLLAAYAMPYLFLAIKSKYGRAKTPFEIIILLNIIGVYFLSHGADAVNQGFVYFAYYNAFLLFIVSSTHAILRVRSEKEYRFSLLKGVTQFASIAFFVVTIGFTILLILVVVGAIFHASGYEKVGAAFLSLFNTQPMIAEFLGNRSWSDFLYLASFGINILSFGDKKIW